MTNLEWLKTLSAEEFADWLYDEWLHHLQYRWSSSRGGLIIWLKDRKTEPQLTPNYCGTCKHREVPCGDLPCDACHSYSNYEPKDEPQTVIHCKDEIWTEAREMLKKWAEKDEPQTERSEE